MSWMVRLYETYNNCVGQVGAETSENEVPLLPICHTTQKAQVEIVLDGEGIFKRAKIIPKNDARTIIPCTENSSSRTSGESAHPLCDKLQYLAIDYLVRSGGKKAYSDSFITLLESWCSSDYSDPKLIAILNYVKRGRIIEDLIDQKIFISGDDGKLISTVTKTPGVELPKIFDVLAIQEDAFIRWVVEIPGVLETRVWRDKSLWNKWIKFYLHSKINETLCYASGEMHIPAELHPAKIRNDGDKAKIISANDASNFTYRGRFTEDDQPVTVSLEVSQKAHSALRWLISRQGYRKEDLAVVAWATTGAPIPKPTDDALSILDIDDMPEGNDISFSTAQTVGVKLRNKIAGYRGELGDITSVDVMVLDSATTGRLSVVYFCELKGSDFLVRIDSWQVACAWLHTYGSIEVKDGVTGKPKKKIVPFIGAPSPADIAEAAYGSRVDDNLRKSTIKRILPCIIESRKVPLDLVESTFRRACNRQSMDYWKWNKTLSIACALFKNYQREENFSMALDTNRKTRDYLYGRLLALAESLEDWALSLAGENRETNAARLMQRFSERPYSTWRTIELALNPYKARLGGKSSKRQRMIDDVVASFDPSDFLSDRRLSGEFLLGYHCQREFLRNQTELNQEAEVVNR